MMICSAKIALPLMEGDAKGWRPVDREGGSGGTIYEDGEIPSSGEACRNPG
jgi:hypothetical protein